MCDDSRRDFRGSRKTRKGPQAGGEPVVYRDGELSTPLQCMEEELKQRDSRIATMARRAQERGLFPLGRDALARMRTRTWRSACGLTSLMTDSLWVD